MSDGNYNVCFSCVCYLNSSLSLLPDNSTDQDRAVSIIQGYHGLQLYANQFWFKHLLAYCRLRTYGRLWIPNDLKVQLELLLHFQKDDTPGSSGIQETLLEQEAELAVLNQLLPIKGLVSNIIGFRRGFNRDDLFDSTPGGEFPLQRSHVFKLT